MLRRGTEDRNNPYTISSYLGSILLLSIIPIKLIRFVFRHYSWAFNDTLKVVTGFAPSFLGSAGLLLLLLSDKGRLSRLSVNQMALLTGIIAIGLEVLQLIHPPIARLSNAYRFDPIDIAASLLGLGLGYVMARAIFKGMGRGI